MSCKRTTTKIVMIEPAMTPPPRPPAVNPKTLTIQIRANAREHALIGNQASENASLTVSSWARSVLVAEARKALRRER